MDPTIIAKLLPTAVELLQEMGKTNLGKEMTGKAQKFLKVAIPAAKKASQISIDFLATDVGESLLGKSSPVELSKPLDIVANGLSLPMSYK